MIRKKRQSVGWLCLAMLAGLAIAVPASARDRFDPVRTYIRERLKDGSIPSVTVAVVEDGRTVWAEGFGWANREKRIPADPDTVYSLASISKPITATAIMTLVEAGKIKLDAPANDYLGFAKLTAHVGDARDATIRNILAHTSGLPYHWQCFYSDEAIRPPSRDETILRYGHLLSKPGEQTQYSNIGYGVLDYIVSRKSGRPFADYLRANIFLPLGMTRSSVDIAPGLEPYAAERYGTNGLPIPFYTGSHDGASNVYSSARDLVRFALFHMKMGLPDQKKILSDATIDEMHRPVSRPDWGENTFFGLGFEGDRRYSYRSFGHSGGMGGVSTLLTMFPDQRSAIVILSNSENDLPDRLTDRIANILFKGWKVSDPPPESTEVPRLVPPPALVGAWRGALSTYQGDTPVTLDVLPNGEVRVRFGSQSVMLVDKPRFADGILSGTVDAQIPTSDTAPFRHEVRLKLRLRDARLEGAASAVGPFEPRWRYALSHWLSLAKAPDGEGRPERQ